MMTSYDCRDFCVFMGGREFVMFDGSLICAHYIKLMIHYKKEKKMIQPNTSSARIMENNIATPVKARVKPQVFG
jgi:hypothetical protein